MSILNDLLSRDNLELDIKNLIEKAKTNSPVSNNMSPSFFAFDKLKEEITIEFPVKESQLNEHDTMHAGFITAAFDEAFGIVAAYLGQGSGNVSINISINYIKPIPKGDTIRISVKATSLGRRVLTVTGECHLSSNGLLTNTALATFAIVG